MSDDIQIVMTADDRDLMQSFLKQGDKIAKLQEQLRRWQKEAMEAGKASKKAADDSAKGAERAIKGVAGMAAGWLSAAGAVSAYMAANKEAIAESEKHAEVLDDVIRKFRIQSNMSFMQGEGAKASILKNAARAGVTKEQAFAAATQLGSSGMEAGEAAGPGLRAFLDVLAASNETGKAVDSEGLSKALMQYLETQGMAKTGANVSQIGGQVQALFKGTNLQLSNLPFLASEGAGLAMSIKPEEQLAAFAKLADEYGGAESATSLRNVVQRLATASKNKTAQSALKEIGVSVDEIDFSPNAPGEAGENLDQVLKRMKEGLETVPEKKRAGILKAIFEEKGVAPFMSLANGREKIAEYVKLQQDQTGFRADVQIAQNSRGAAGRRLDLEEEVGLAEKAGNTSQVRKAMRNTMRKEGLGPFNIWARSAAFDVGTGLGMPAEMALATAVTDPLHSLGKTGSMVATAVGQRDLSPSLIAGTMDRVGAANGVSSDRSAELDAMLELARATRKNTEALKATAPLVPRGVSAPAPRPISGAGRP